MDNYATFAEPMKPPACEQRKFSQAESSCKRKTKKRHMKLINNRTPHKSHATHNDKVDGDGDHYAMDMEVKDVDNPLDM